MDSMKRSTEMKDASAGAFKRGDQVIYIPTHAHGDKEHKDCEYGFVTSSNEKFVFVRYWRRDDPYTLRTTANSEATDPNDLHRVPWFHNKAFIARILAEIGETS